MNTAEKTLPEVPSHQMQAVVEKGLPNLTQVLTEQSENIAMLRQDVNTLIDMLIKTGPIKAPNGEDVARKCLVGTAETARRAQVGRNSASRGWTYAGWLETFGLVTYRNLPPKKQAKADRGPLKKQFARPITPRRSKTR